ncbi:hypothetical protein OHJ21_08530 [Virgibacillus sp. LDC1]|nr:hypothetical protein [Virgibacillus sp. LDC1]
MIEPIFNSADIYLLPPASREWMDDYEKVVPGHRTFPICLRFIRAKVLT